MLDQRRADLRSPVTILTGFLGSGKTTLLNRALRDPSMGATAVVINEFGEIGIDHALTTTSDDSIVVLENGCLCCTVFGDLVQTLNRLYYAREAAEIAFDRVIIETSGLADLGPLVQAFLSDPTLAGLYRVGAVIATVDGVNGDATLSKHAVSIRQVVFADVILLTKLDLIAEPGRGGVQKGLESRLHRLNPEARIYAAGDPDVDPVQLMRRVGPDPAGGTDALTVWIANDAGASADMFRMRDTRDTREHRHDGSISSCSFVRETPVHREALNLLLASLEKQLGSNLLRVKGIVNVAEEPGRPAVIQGAQHLLHNLSWLAAWPDADHRTRIVFITQDIPKGDLEEMVALLDRVAQRTAAARLRAAATVRPPGDTC